MHVYVLTLIQDQIESILMCIRFYVTFYVTNQRLIKLKIGFFKCCPEKATKSCFIRHITLFDGGTFKHPPPLTDFQGDS